MNSGQAGQRYLVYGLAEDRRGAAALGFVAGAMALSIAVVGAIIGITLSGL